MPELEPPTAEPLSLYGTLTESSPLGWAWVDEQLGAAGTYWAISRGPGHPHPRPVWGVWVDHRLHLSIGSPVITRQLAAEPAVTVHLDNGTEVVLIEGTVTGTTEDAALIQRYDAKYDWTYTIAEYGPLTTVAPTVVMAWRSAGWAGREGVQTAGKWRFG